MLRENSATSEAGYAQVLAVVNLMMVGDKFALLTHLCASLRLIAHEIVSQPHMTLPHMVISLFVVGPFSHLADQTFCTSCSSAQGMRRSHTQLQSLQSDTRELECNELESRSITA